MSTRSTNIQGATPISRRGFMQRTVAGAVALSLPSFARSRSPSEKLNIAIIGCGGRGASNMGEMLMKTSLRFVT